MQTIEIQTIKMIPAARGGRHAVVELDGEVVGLSRIGEDAPIGDASEIQVGDILEAGTERVRVVGPVEE